MARALIVGCGCSGRWLGGALQDAGWVVRGTSRTATGAEEIEGAGIEAAVADPDRIATVLDAIEGVSLIFWLFGTVATPALHGPRLERLLEEIVDTPVRALVYELNAELEPDAARGAFEALRSANERWRIPFEVVAAERGTDSWLEGMLASARELVG
ncbi:MAG: hypothetical protein QOI10_449 [Solirubrobacterales bacterium]|nr:hypothetical protein [Solirubrobacterales bacterium]